MPAPGKPPRKKSSSTLGLKRRLKSKGGSKRRLVGRTRKAMPKAAPASRLQTSRRRERNAAKIAASDQQVTKPSLIGWIADKQKVGFKANSAAPASASPRVRPISTPTK